MSSSKPAHRLGELASTAIAGNDILSSCLYVCGFAILYAGVFAPLVFLGIVFVLWLYKHVYIEVVEALPLNGGAYNCLLNATSKTLAAIAGVMTVLSYVATSVISAKTASEYLSTLIPGLPVLLITGAIIAAFAALTIMGVKDSARVAMVIFFGHVFVLLLLISIGLLAFFNHGAGFLNDNLQATLEIFRAGGSLKMIFFAFAASLLGVSGFESSANFVEEQAPGVFRKTLKNMLLGVWLFNPLITFVVLYSLPYGEIIGAKDFVLSATAFAVGGRGLQILLVIDAFLVLSGAVLASFVGATGLMYRMTLDHCFPSTILLPKLKARNQNTNRIIIAFALLCVSILVLTKGSLVSLAGVYTISFLGVMTNFAIGNVILRFTRPDLKRTYRGSIVIAIVAAITTIAGIVGNIMLDSNNIIYFLIYFVPALFVVQIMIYRDYVLEFILKVTKRVPFIYDSFKPWFDHVIKPRILVFVHHPDHLYRTLVYVQKNETSRNISIIYCRKGDHNAAKYEEKFRQYISVFCEAKVFKNLDITFEVNDEVGFGPEAIRLFANRFRVLRNNVFIGSIHETHSFSFEDLGGVRIIQ